MVRGQGQNLTEQGGPLAHPVVPQLDWPSGSHGESIKKIMNEWVSEWVNEWWRPTSCYRWGNWDPERGRILSIVKAENPHLSDSAHSYSAWGRINMAVENLAPLTMIWTMDLMLSYSSVLFGYQKTSSSFPPHKHASATFSISHSWPTLFSPAQPVHPFNPTQVRCEAFPHSARWVILASPTYMASPAICIWILITLHYNSPFP